MSVYVITGHQEVKGINKQKFLAELGRLLTFMYEEDRRMALAMYSDMFDSCRDEELLIQNLGSPTRQAVAVARNYDAKARKLQLSSNGQEVSSEDVPPFMITIGNITDEVLENNRRSSPVDENQFSLFQDDGQPHIDLDETEPQAVPVEIPSEESPVAPEPAAEPSVASEPAAVSPAAPEPAKSTITVDDFLAGMLDNEPAPSDLPLDNSDTQQTSESVEKDADAAELQDPVDRFIADYSFDADKPVEKAETCISTGADSAFQAADAPDEEIISDAEDSSLYNEELPAAGPKKKASPVLLILYIIAAIPLSLIGIAVLLVLAVIVLALAAVCVVGGLFIVFELLSCLTMIADLMVVLGGGIALFAFGLLFLWTAIWLVGGGIVGFVRGVFALAKKWCYKEVDQ